MTHLRNILRSKISISIEQNNKRRIEMEKSKKIQFNILIEKHERDLLRKLAATKMLNDPSKTCSAAGIGAKII